jgi:hypothetical protein
VRPSCFPAVQLVSPTPSSQIMGQHDHSDLRHHASKAEKGKGAPQETHASHDATGRLAAVLSHEEKGRKNNGTPSK